MGFSCPRQGNMIYFAHFSDLNDPAVPMVFQNRVYIVFADRKGGKKDDYGLFAVFLLARLWPKEALPAERFPISFLRYGQKLFFETRKLTISPPILTNRFIRPARIKLPSGSASRDRPSDKSACPPKG